MRWRRSARHATDTMKRLFTPAGGRRRLVLGAFRGVASSPSHGPARNSSRVSGTPLVGGVSATDGLLRQVPGAEAATDARPGGRGPATLSEGAASQAAEAEPRRHRAFGGGNSVPPDGS